MEIQITQDLVQKNPSHRMMPDAQYIEDFLTQRGFINETLTFGRVKNLLSVKKITAPCSFSWDM